MSIPTPEDMANELGWGASPKMMMAVAKAVEAERDRIQALAPEKRLDLGLSESHTDLVNEHNEVRALWLEACGEE